jgi:hypothetical protein
MASGKFKFSGISKAFAEAGIFLLSSSSGAGAAMPSGGGIRGGII